MNGNNSFGSGSGITPREYVVELKHRFGTYPIFIKAGILGDLGRRLKDSGFNGKILIVTNPRVADLYLDRVTRSLVRAGFDPVVFHMPDGEEFKSIPVANAIWEIALKAGLDRGSAIMGLGGGVACDMAGFAASTYMRGISFLQVPTTLLCQVDASVGGKVAVNMPWGKNSVGAFHQPRAVYIDPLTLATLDERDLRSGLAEVIKHGAALDESLFRKLEDLDPHALWDPEAMSLLITENVRIKAGIVSGDEMEKGPRALLNFGHTLAHALESMTGYTVLRHGEAIAMGMAFAARLSRQLGRIGIEEEERVIGLISKSGLPVDLKGLPEPMKVSEIIDAMSKDKKSVDGDFRFVVLDGLGASSYGVAVSGGTLEPILVGIGAKA